MPKAHRLTGRDLRASRPVRRIQGAFFSLSLLPLSTGKARLTVVVSKKVAVKAVDRNLIKRRTRAAARAHLKTLPPVGLLLTAKKEAKGATYRALAEDVAILMNKVDSAR